MFCFFFVCLKDQGRTGNQRYRDDRHVDNTDFTQAGGRSSNNNFNSDPQSRHPQR